MGNTMLNTMTSSSVGSVWFTEAEGDWKSVREDEGWMTNVSVTDENKVSNEEGIVSMEEEAETALLEDVVMTSLLEEDEEEEEEVLVGFCCIVDGAVNGIHL